MDDELLKRIKEASTKLLYPLSQEETFATIIKEALPLVNGEYGSVFLSKNGVLERVYASSNVLYEVKIRKKGFTYKAFTAKKPAILGIDKVGKVHPEIKQDGVLSAIFIPLLYKDKAFGVISIDSKTKETLTKAELSALELYGVLASLAIRKTELYEESKQAVELRNFFISSAAHELRTPITSISGYIQLLHNKLSGKDSAESRWVEQLFIENQRLVNLAKELLEANRIKSDTADYYWNELIISEIIARAVNRLQYHYPLTKVVVTNKLSAKHDVVIGDFGKLLQVFYNVLENAAEFSPRNATIQIIIQEKEKSVMVKVKDSGKGMSPDEVKRVFDGYLNGSEMSNKKGFGIGLFLTKHIIQKHHGSIEIQSKMSKGTTVTIRIPQAKV